MQQKIIVIKRDLKYNFNALCFWINQSKANKIVVDTTVPESIDGKIANPSISSEFTVSYTAKLHSKL